MGGPVQSLCVFMYTFAYVCVHCVRCVCESVCVCVCVSVNFQILVAHASVHATNIPTPHALVLSVWADFSLLSKPPTTSVATCFRLRRSLLSSDHTDTTYVFQIAQTFFILAPLTCCRLRRSLISNNHTDTTYVFQIAKRFSYWHHLRVADCADH